MLKRILAVFLCLGIAFLPAISSAGAGKKIPGTERVFLPPLPKPKAPNKIGTAQPELKLKVAPKPKLKAVLTTDTAWPELMLTTASKPKPKAVSTTEKAQPEIKPTVVPKPKAQLTTETAKPELKLTAAQKKKAKTAPVSASPATLPVAVTDSSGNTILGQGISNISSSGNTEVITQSAPRAIQDWSSFNISANGTVQFQQANSNWVAVNRIFDRNPTQIFGKIVAPGQIYLINQNGILFGRGSQVDVHTLIASTLDIDREAFTTTGALNFTAGDYQGTGNTNYLDASVINKGTLSTDSVGSVFLLAPYVENDGVIQTQFGQVGLAAAKAVDIYQNVSVRDWLIVDVTGQVYGDAVNGNNGHAVNNGQITANNGLIGMYGTGVDQNGVVSVETSLSSQSHDEDRTHGVERSVNRRRQHYKHTDICFIGEGVTNC